MCEVGILLILIGLDLYHSASSLFHRLIFHETTNSVSPLDLAVRIIALMTLLLAYRGRVTERSRVVRSIASEVVLPVITVNGFKPLLSGQFITFLTNDTTTGKITIMLVNVLFLPGLLSNAQQLCCSQTQRAEADEKKALEREVDRLRKERNEGWEAMDHLMKEKEALEHDVDRLRKERNEGREATDHLVKEKEALEHDVDRLRKDMVAYVKEKERDVDRLRKERNEGREAMDHLMKEKEALKRDVDRLRKERNEGRKAMVAYKNDVEAFLRQKGQEERAEQLLKAGLQILGLFFGVTSC